MEKDKQPGTGVVNESGVATALFALYEKYKKEVEAKEPELNAKRADRPELVGDPDFNFEWGAVLDRKAAALDIGAILMMYAGRDVDAEIQALSDTDSQQ